MTEKLNYGFLGPGGEQGTKLLVDIDKVPSDDPLAYVHGFVQAYSGREVNVVDDMMVPEYLKGHQHGTSVNKGNEPLPLWATDEAG